MGNFWRDLVTLAKETPDERRMREREGRVVSKPKPASPAHVKYPPTDHPDDQGRITLEAKGKRRK